MFPAVSVCVKLREASRSYVVLVTSSTASLTCAAALRLSAFTPLSENPAHIPLSCHGNAVTLASGTTKDRSTDFACACARARARKFEDVEDKSFGTDQRAVCLVCVCVCVSQVNPPSLVALKLVDLHWPV